MNTLRTLLFLSFLYTPVALSAQQKPDCTDIVYVQGGSVYRGTITNYDAGDAITLVTWSGVNMTLSKESINKIVQRCKDDKRPAKIYDFKERGLYNATNMGVLVGETYFGENSTGYSLCHSAGWMFNRWIGAGIGVGLETYNPDGEEAGTYPIFAELRGYFQAKNVAPFYTIGGGWAFTGKNADSRQGYIENWDGGWLAKAQVGYRLGNNFTLFGGIRLQKKIRNWQSVWGGDWGQDRILHKRLELGFGLLL